MEGLLQTITKFISYNQNHEMFSNPNNVSLFGLLILFS